MWWLQWWGFCILSSTISTQLLEKIETNISSEASALAQYPAKVTSDLRRPKLETTITKRQIVMSELRRSKLSNHNAIISFVFIIYKLCFGMMQRGLTPGWKSVIDNLQLQWNMFQFIHSPLFYHLNFLPYCQLLETLYFNTIKYRWDLIESS